MLPHYPAVSKNAPSAELVLFISPLKKACGEESATADPLQHFLNSRLSWWQSWLILATLFPLTLLPHQVCDSVFWISLRLIFFFRGCFFEFLLNSFYFKKVLSKCTSGFQEGESQGLFLRGEMANFFNEQVFKYSWSGNCYVSSSNKKETKRHASCLETIGVELWPAGQNRPLVSF